MNTYEVGGSLLTNPISKPNQYTLHPPAAGVTASLPRSPFASVEPPLPPCTCVRASGIHNTHCTRPFNYTARASHPPSGVSYAISLAYMREDSRVVCACARVCPVVKLKLSRKPERASSLSRTDGSSLPILLTCSMHGRTSIYVYMCVWSCINLYTEWDKFEVPKRNYKVTLGYRYIMLKLQLAFVNC